MSSQPNFLFGPNASGIYAIREYAATRQDLMHMGYSDHRTRLLLRDNEPRELHPTEALRIPAIPGPDVVALVPVGSLALEVARLGAYIRAEELLLPVHLRATHIGWAQSGKVSAALPILNRFRIGSYRAIPNTGVGMASNLMASPVIESWSGPSKLFELGQAVPLSVDLGYRPNRGGGVQGIAGTRHYFLHDLIAATSSGVRLVDLSTI